MTSLRSIAAALLMFCLVPRAYADSRAPTPTPTPSAADETEARRLYSEGTKAYNLAEYTDAITDFKAAYKLVPKAGFLLNIAQAYRLAGDLRAALVFYRSFTRTAPESTDRDEAEAHIKELEAALAKPAAHETRIPAPDRTAEAGQHAEPPPHLHPAPAPRDGSRPIYKKWWFWGGLGAVAVGAAVAVIALSGGSAGPPSTDLGNHNVFGP